MVLFAIGVEHALDVAVQRPHDADPREYRGTARRRDQDQGFHCCLPLRGLVLVLRELGDVVAGVLERDELATVRQRNRIVEPSFPAAISHSRAVAIVPNPNPAGYQRLFGRKPHKKTAVQDRTIGHDPANRRP